MLRRALIALAAAWFGLALACAQTPNQNLLRMNGGYKAAYLCNYLNGAFCGGESYSTTSLRTVVDATGVETYAPNNMATNSNTASSWGKSVLKVGIWGRKTSYFRFSSSFLARDTILDHYYCTRRGGLGLF